MITNKYIRDDRSDCLCLQKDSENAGAFDYAIYHEKFFFDHWFGCCDI